MYYGRTGFGAPIRRARTGTGSAGGQPPNREGEPRTAPIGPRHTRRPDWSRRPARAILRAIPIRGAARRRGPNTCPRRGDMPGARALRTRRGRWVGGPWNQNHLFSQPAATYALAFSSATHTGERARRCTASQWVRRRCTTYITFQSVVGRRRSTFFVTRLYHF